MENEIQAQPAKSNRTLWIAGGIALALVCLCVVVCIALGATGFVAVLMERAPIESVLDDFMTSMESGDIQRAYALFSPRAQRQTQLTDLRRMVQGNNYVLFEGYRQLSVESLNINAAVNSNPDLPQGTVANVDGIVLYAGGVEGQFTAVLEQVNGQWMIYSVTVTVPPDKFDS